jgi:hypothetical protein
MNSMPENFGLPIQAPLSRRDFMRAAFCGSIMAAIQPGFAAGSARDLKLPLADATGLTIEGPHRFREVSGRTGLQLTSLKSKATIATALARAPEGTLSLWFSPLEDLSFNREVESEPDVPFDYPLVSDVFPGHNLRQTRFGVFVRAGYPALLAKFAGGSMWERMDHGLAPFAYAEKILLRQGYWYHLAVTWDRPGREMQVYVNGMMAGHNLRADGFENAGPELHLGNPMFVLRDFRLEPRVAAADEIARRYRQDRPAENAVTEADFRAMLAPAFGAPLELRRDASWRSAYECSFRREAETKAWLLQGPGEQHRSELRRETSAEGLYLKSPDKIANDTRLYLWSPRTFEGDHWAELDVRLESPVGLALLVMCASGMQREDYFADYGVPATGSMKTILRDLRNYHWEFMRRVEAMRTDVETQYLAKNPFGRRLHASCIPRLEQNRWYRLRFIVAGRRLHGSIDGRTVFDVMDDPYGNNGPVYNFGRLGLRLMYATAMRFRDLAIWTRPSARAES